ncbi:ethanolamine utilization protein EutH [Anaerovorax odorimutans]|uniref:ethanolamine utilization protein EutH n=1 Tax=Anaerovorax odorimutans TaxID=109327 RepID=UPI0003F6C3A1|nr:ethanolamine utilization protein EutH [Anaerovorax odorimutans]
MFKELISAAANTEIFTQSIHNFFSDISINKIIVCIMVLFMIIGGIDKIRGNKGGYGEKFDEGFLTLGPLAIAMLGIITLAPVLRVILEPIIAPIFKFIGADPSVFAGILLGCDMGGYPLAMELAGSQSAGYFAGLIVASMMGASIVFTIPVALNIIERKDRTYLAIGVLIGIVTIPIGCIIGGIMMNLTEYKISFQQIILNTVPIIILSLILAIGLWFCTDKMLKGFLIFGKSINILITIGTILAVSQYLTGIRLPLFYMMVEPDKNGSIPLEEGIMIIGSIALVLIGAFPMVHFITKVFSNQLTKVGNLIGIDKVSSVGLIANLANNLLVFQLLKDMNSKGKLLNCTFAVSAAFVFGDYLGFVAGVNQEMILPVVLAKLSAGISALIIASLFSNRLLKNTDL